MRLFLLFLKTMKDKLYIIAFVPLLLFTTGIKGEVLNTFASTKKSEANSAAIKKEECLNNFSKNQYSSLLQNKVKDYLKFSSRTGIKPCSNYKQLLFLKRKSKLQNVKNNVGYSLDDFTFSYPLLVPYANRLLKEIGVRFEKELENTPLKGSKFIVTSLTRTTHSVKRLGKKNINSIQRSPHLNGNSMDFSFSRFKIVKNSTVTSCDKQFLQETLSKILYELKIKKKCWVTFERYENCLHVVAKKVNL